MATSKIYATKTPTAAASSLVIPAAAATGYLDPAWLLRGDLLVPASIFSIGGNTSAVFGTGATLSLATQTANTIWAGPVTGSAAAPTFRALVAADFPASIRSLVSLFDHYVDAGNSTTTETDIYADTLAAGQLATNGDKLECEYGGIFVSSASATRQIKMKFAGTAIFDTGALSLSLSSAWTLFAAIIRVSATVIRYSISLTTQGASSSAYTASGELTGLTLLGTNVLKLTGTAAGIGAATNDIVAKMGSVVYITAA